MQNNMLDLDKNKTEKRQFLLRVSEPLMNYIEKWAEEDFRSTNCQIEYLLNECVKEQQKKKNDL